MTAEILSIIAIIISGLTAICSASIPAILSYKAKKAELKQQKEMEDKKTKEQKAREEQQIKEQKAREEKQKYEEKFEEYYQTHLKVLKDFSTHYENWKIDPQNCTTLVKFINEIAPEFRYSTNSWLYEFADKIGNYKKGDNLDEDYKRCRQLILSNYGVRVSADTPNFFMSDMLKTVLREQFDKLQNSSGKDFHFHKR